MFRFTSLGSDRTALTEVSNIFVNLFTVSFVFSLNTLDSQRDTVTQTDRDSQTYRATGSQTHGQTDT